MAVEYALITWAGLGTTVTFTDAGDVVNMTAHGAPNGHAFRFTTTRSLPTGLTAGTTYYLGAGADANKFLVYPTQADAIAGTNQVAFSGTGSGTNQVVGEYWASLSTSGRARYGPVGSEQVYGKINSAATYYNSSVDLARDLIIEIEGAWTDTLSSTVNIIGQRSIVFTSTVDGVRSSAWHGGGYTSGYIAYANTTYTTLFSVEQPNVTIDGLNLQQPNTGTTSRYAISLSVSSSRVTVINCIIKGPVGIYVYSPDGIIANNIIHDCYSHGIQNRNATGINLVIAFNLITGCGGTGMYNETGVCYSQFYGNISIGNTVNWTTVTPSGRFYAAYSGGLSSDATWDTTSTKFTIDTTDFADYANKDFSPALSTSPQVELISLLDGDRLPREDMLAAVRPNYINATTDKADAGPFEFDHGNGLAPQTVPISITGMASGSEIAIYKASNMNEILAPQSTTGSYSSTYTYTGDTNIIVRVRKGTSATRYLPYEYAGTITSTGFQLVVSQIPDTIAQ